MSIEKGVLAQINQEIDRAASERLRRWQTPWHLWTKDISARVEQLTRELDALYAEKRQLIAGANRPKLNSILLTA